MSMILGMTASAASAHKHEFSPPAAHEPEMNQHDQYPFSHPLLYLQGRLQAFAGAFVSPVAGESSHTSSPAGAAHESSASTPARSSLELASSDGGAHDNEVQSPTLTTIAQVPKVATPRTAYLLSHPAPRARSHRIKAKNRMLLQLRKADDLGNRSPAPALELYPGSAFPRSMARRLPQSLKKHHHGHGLGSSDLLVLNCESHRFEGNNNSSGGARLGFGGGSMRGSKGHQHNDMHNDDEEALALRHREIVGSIHAIGEDESGRPAIELCLGSSRWTATHFAKGRYEFRGTDDEGHEIVARWFTKHSAAANRRSRRSSSVLDASHVPANTASANNSDRKFSFSLLRPETRRHPIVGRMDAARIEVFDQYIIPDAPDTPAATPSAMGSPTISDMGMATGGTSGAFSPLSLGDGNSKSYFNTTATSYPAPNTIVETSADLKKLILVTGIWVAIAEGWSEALGPSALGEGLWASCAREMGPKDNGTTKGTDTKRRESMGASMPNNAAGHGSDRAATNGIGGSASASASTSHHSLSLRQRACQTRLPGLKTSQASSSGGGGGLQGPKPPNGASDTWGPNRSHSDSIPNRNSTYTNATTATTTTTTTNAGSSRASTTTTPSTPSTRSSRLPTWPHSSQRHSLPASPQATGTITTITAGIDEDDSPPRRGTFPPRTGGIGSNMAALTGSLRRRSGLMMSATTPTSNAEQGGSSHSRRKSEALAGEDIARRGSPRPPLFVGRKERRAAAAAAAAAVEEEEERARVREGDGNGGRGDDGDEMTAAAAESRARIGGFEEERAGGKKREKFLGRMMQRKGKA